MSILKMIILIIPFLVFAILPVLIIGVDLSDNKGLKFQFIVMFLIHWGIAYFFFRLIAWNIYGTEIYSFSRDKITSYLDYKFFSNQAKEINREGIIFRIEDIGYKEDGWAILVIENKKGGIISNIKVQKQELESFIESNIPIKDS